MLQETINQLLQSTLEQVKNCTTTKALSELRVRVLGKSGELTNFMRNLKTLSPEDKPLAGKIVNEARVEIEEAMKAVLEVLEKHELEERLLKERIDITIDAKPQPKGGLHPLTIVRNKIERFFLSHGFTIVDSPEIETDYYNFEALNIPSDHPAREMQDTFFISEKFLLRSQTSSGQIRTMENTKPPIKMISPGRVFRADDPDATHSPMFHQIEGLLVDKCVTMCDLKGILELFAKEFFGEKTKTRFRPSHFPFTEPSVEVDATCFKCSGEGCRICKGTGWIEILGAGMVNRNVLRNCGIDPDIYTGYAFGMGLDRITNILHEITDLRVVFENDIRFLKQFN